MTSGGSAAAAAAAASVTSTASSSSSNQNSSSSASSDQQQASSMATSSTTSSSSTSSSAAAAAPTTTVDIPPQLAQLSEGWLELESDPGLFSLLISDFGVRGVQVEEIYDLERPFPEQQPVVYGFIFLFNVIEERRNRSRRRDAADNLLSSGGLGGGGNGGGLGSGGYGYGFGDTPLENPSPSSLLTGEYLLEDDGNEANQELLKQIFFAYQKVPNSCATHAILSVLLNCSQVDLGPMLRRLKDYTRDMSAESKGYAISNIPELAVAHNSHAAPLSAHREQQAKGAATNAVRISQRHSSSCEAFHYVSFLPIGGRLIELDGLKEAPIDHGPVDEEGENGGEPWTEKFRRLMRKRIEITVSGGQGSHSHHHSTEHDIRYNLMAVIPSRYERAAANLRAMSANRLALLKMIQILEFSSPAGGHVRRDHSYAREGLLPSGPNSYPGPQSQTQPQTQNPSEAKSPKDTLKRKGSNGEISEASSPKRKNVSGGGGSLNLGLEWPDPLKLARSPGTIRMTLDDERLLSAKEEEEGLGGGSGSSSSRGNFTFGYDFPKGDGPFGGSKQSDLEHPLMEDEEDTEEEKPTEWPPLPSTSSSEMTSMPNKLTDDVKNEEKTEEEEEDDDDRTETASNASSSYNDLFEAEDGEEQVASNSKGGSEPTVFESRFFVCKFEHRPKSTASEDRKTALEVPTENKENETKKIKVEVDGEQTPTIVKIENDEASKATIKPSSKSTTSNFPPPPPPTSSSSSTSSSTITPTIITTPSEESSATTISTTNKQIYSVLERIRALQSSSSSPSPSSPSVADFESHLKAPILKDLLTLLNGLNRQIGAARRRHAEEEAKQRRYRLDDSRRVHDYDPFITSFLAMFFEAGLMESVLEAELYQGGGGSSNAAATAAAAEAAAVEAAVAAAAAAASLGAAPAATSEKAAAAAAATTSATSKGERSSARAAALEKQQQQQQTSATTAVNGTAGNAAAAGKKDTTKDGLQIPNGTELGPLAPIVNTFSPAELTKASIALRRIYEQALFFPANFSVSAAMAAMKSAAAAAAATAANQNTAENKSSSANKSRRSRGKRGSNRLAVEEDDDDEMYEVYEEDEGDGEEEADDEEWNPAEENTPSHPKGSSSSSRSRQSK